MWQHVPIEDPRLAAIADADGGHYSRQTEGAKGVVAPGYRFALWHDGARGSAAWGVVRNRFRKQWRFRNSFFRNLSSTRSSDLIREATRETFALWIRRYKALPPEPLESEIGIEETARRRSKRHVPGHCYAMAGWELVRFMPRGHGRSAKAIYAAITSAPALFFPRHWMLIGQWMQLELDAAKRAAKGRR